VGNDVVVEREGPSLAQTSFCMEFFFSFVPQKRKKEKDKKTLLYDRGVNGIG